MSLFYKSVDVSAKSTYDAAANAEPGFEPKKYRFVLEETTTTVNAIVSFDGVNDQGVLVPGGTGMVWECKQQLKKVWVRRIAAGGAATMVVHITAEN